MLTTPLGNSATALGVGRAERGGTAAAHEFTHMVIQPTLDGETWNDQEHEITTDRDGLMGLFTATANRQEATVVIKETTQREYDLAGNPALTP